MASSRPRSSPRSQTPFGNALCETPFRERTLPEETEFPAVRSQTEFGNEGWTRAGLLAQWLSLALANQQHTIDRRRRKPFALTIGPGHFEGIDVLHFSQSEVGARIGAAAKTVRRQHQPVPALLAGDDVHTGAQRIPFPRDGA